MSILHECRECGTEIDLEFTATSTTDREEFWGVPVSMESVEIEFESDLRCPECGCRFDEAALTDRAVEEAVEHV